MGSNLSIDEVVDGKTAELTVGAVREVMQRLDTLDERLTKLEQELPSGTTAVREAEKVARLDKRATTATRERAQIRDKLEELESTVSGAGEGSLYGRIQQIADVIYSWVEEFDEGPTENGPLQLRKLSALLSQSKQESATSSRQTCPAAIMEAMQRLGVTRYRDGDLEIELTPGAAPSFSIPDDRPVVPLNYRIAAEALWGLLDDIAVAAETATSDAALRAEAKVLAAGRVDYGRSPDGGKRITWSWQKDDPGSYWHQIHEVTSDAQGPLDHDIPDDGPPGVPEPTESPSGFGIDHGKLTEMMEARAAAMKGKLV